MSTAILYNLTLENSTRPDGEWIETKRLEIYTRLLPVIILMSILQFVGTVGNILTLIFYSKQTKSSPSRNLILCLSAVDLIVCICILPTVLEMVFNVGHQFVIVCKLSHFFGHWTIALSSLILWIIAIERYRKICVPFGRQMTVKSAHYTFIGCTIFSLAISIRDGIHFELVPVDINITEENRTITGTMCTTSSDSKYRISILMFYGLDTFLVFTCWTTIIVTYSRIALTLFRLNKKATERHQTTKSTLQRIQREMDSNTADITTEINSNDDFKTVSTTNINKLGKGGIYRSASNVNHRKQKKPKNPAESASERLMTLMMLTVSVGFIVCILPYFAVRVTRLLLKLDAEHELLLGSQFALRLTYVNSVFNPIVYCCFNPRFRHYFKDKLSACFNRRR